MRPLDPQPGEQDLIDRPDGRRRAQELSGALRGPAREARLFVGLVLPEDFELLDTSPCGSSSDEIARDCKNGLDVCRRRKKPVQRPAYSIVQLLRRGTRRQREVQTIHEAVTPQRSETQGQPPPVFPDPVSLSRISSGRSSGAADTARCDGRGSS